MSDADISFERDLDLTQAVVYRAPGLPGGNGPTENPIDLVGRVIASTVLTRLVNSADRIRRQLSISILIHSRAIPDFHSLAQPRCCHKRRGS